MAQRVLGDSRAARLFIRPESVAVDQRLPEWARRTNPVVRRHLGAYWKMLTPDFGIIFRLVALQAAFVVLSYPVPQLFTVIMPTVTVSLVLLPAALIMYMQLLIAVGTASTISMADERRNDTLPLLLIIPRPLQHILYSKVAAALWRQVENFGLIQIAVALFSLPILIIQYDILLSMESNPILMRVTLLLALVSALLRIALEPIMVGALGVMCGAFVRGRVPSVVVTALLVAAYFGVTNGLRLLSLDPLARILVDTVLPVVLPVLITLGAFRFAAVFLRRD